MPYGNPYEAPDPIARGLSTYQTLEGIKGAKEDREFQQEQRGLARVDRQRSDEAYARGKALEEPVADVLAERAKTKADADEDRTFQRDEQEQKRQDWAYTNTGRLTKTQMERLNALKMTEAEQGVQQGQLTMQATRGQLADQADARREKVDTRTTVRRILEQRGTALHKFQALKDEPTANTLMDTYLAMQDGDQAKMRTLLPQALPALGRVMQDELDRGVGEPVHGTDDIITKKELKQAYIDGDSMVLELNVIAKNAKTGKERMYPAPRTVGGSSAPDAQVLRIPLDKAQAYLQEAAATAHKIHSGELTEQQIDDEARNSLAGYLPAKDIDALLGKYSASAGGAITKDLDGLMKYAGNDQAKAIELYAKLKAASARPRNERYELVKSLVQAQGTRVTPEDVDRLMAMTEAPAAAAGGDGGATIKPGTVEDGYRFKGGDPADQANWEPE